MTRPLLIVVDGTLYKPVPVGSGSGGFDIGLKLYQGESCRLYNWGAYKQTMLVDNMGYVWDYADTDPSNGKRYVVESGERWRMFNGELYVEQGNYGWIKASEHPLTTAQ